jgi:hypothetical protein
MSARKSSVMEDCDRTEVVSVSGAGEPANESNREAWKYNELSPSLQCEMSTRRRFSPEQASSGRNPGGGAMEVVYSRCAGLDVHKKSVSACVLCCEADGSKRHDIRVFGTTTRDLLSLADWLNGAWSYACSNGGHRSVLAASVGNPGRPPPSAVGQSPTHSSRTGPKDRHPRLRVDRRPAAARIVAR